MSERFFTEPITGDRATLDGPEAHHLLHVMRAAVGQEVTLFDDSGAEFTGVVEALQRSTVELRVTERHDLNRELPFSLVVGVALPKGDRQKWLVDKLTELGAGALLPLSTNRGVAQPTDAVLQRLRRSVIEAAKQCGRNRLMQIAHCQAWSDWVAAPSSDQDRRLVAHPGGVPLYKLDLVSLRPTQLAIGPEGGLTDAEVASAVDAGWTAVDLGPRILRVETAAVALAAAVALLSPPAAE
jgi:16S rRNA (uracil1498-N3)-methyltransferase